MVAGIGLTPCSPAGRRGSRRASGEPRSAEMLLERRFPRKETHPNLDRRPRARRCPPKPDPAGLDLRFDGLWIPYWGEFLRRSPRLILSIYDNKIRVEIAFQLRKSEKMAAR